MYGLMSTMDAPVVPRRFETTAPMARRMTFAWGVDLPFILIWMPPETTKSEPISAIKLMYSNAVLIIRGAFSRMKK
jgi:hypothetical protein